MHVVGPSNSAAVAASSHKPAKSAPTAADALAAGTQGAGPVDVVSLSTAAQELSVHGNSANSPAHRARALIAERPDLADMPFGKVVSGLIHGTLPDAPAPASTTDATDTGAIGDPPPMTGDEPPVVPVGDAAAPGTDSADAAPGGEQPPAVTDGGVVVPPADPSDTTAAGRDFVGEVADVIAPAPDAIDTAELIEELLDQSAPDAEAV